MKFKEMFRKANLVYAGGILAVAIGMVMVYQSGLIDGTDEISKDIMNATGFNITHKGITKSFTEV